MNWWQRLFRGKELEQHLDKELRFHFDSQVADQIRRGVPPDEARRQARMQFGGMETVKEECRDARGTQVVESTINDIRYSLRTLWKTPAFTLAAIGTLALGIGANSAIFQLLDAVRLRSLPIPDPQQLVRIRIKGGNRGFGLNNGEDRLTWPLWTQIRDHNPLAKVFAWVPDEFRVGEGPQAHRMPGILVTGEFFSALQIPPAAGRLIGPEDDVPGCAAPGVVLSFATWQAEFGGKASAIGQKLIVAGQPFRVIGVTPAGFNGLEVGDRFGIAVPICAFKPERAPAELFWLVAMGRLARGTSLAQASDRLSAMSPAAFAATMPGGYSADHLALYKTFRLEATEAGNGTSWLRSEYDRTLWMLLGITGLVLLIACANLANLMLARAGARQKEFAVRLALGASRGRLIRQTMVESLLLSATGAALGLALSRVLSRGIVWFLGEHIELDLGADWRMLAFTASVAVIACLIFGLVPAVRSSRSDPGSAIKSGGRGLTAGRERFSVQRALVVLQVAVSLMLVAGALLFMRSFRNLMTLDPGFREKGMLLVNVDLRPARLAPAELRPFQRELLETVRNTPQVEAAASTTMFLVGGGSWGHGIMAGSEKSDSRFTWVSPGHFAALDIPLIAGRDFTDKDTETSPHVAIVNQSFARRFWGDANPIGKTFRTLAEPQYPETMFEVVGVVKDTRYFNIRDKAPMAAFAPAPQYPAAGPWSALYIRTSAPPAVVMDAVKKRVAQLNPQIALDYRVMEATVQEGFMRERLMAALSGFFGALAALLATIGLSGLIAFLMVRRRNEIGIRIALGASRGQVVGMVMTEAAVLVAIGSLIGVAGAAALARAAESLLFGLDARDPVTFAAAAALLATAAALGSFLPANRASRLDPMVALRTD